MANWWIIVVGGALAIIGLILVWKLTGNEHLLAKKITSAVAFIVPIVIAVFLMFLLPVTSDKDVSSESPTISEYKPPSVSAVTVSEKIEPNITFEPLKPQSNEIVTIRVGIVKSEDDYTVYINFPDKNGEFATYTDLRYRAEYTSEQWVLNRKFNSTTQFRVEVYSESKHDLVYISEIYSIEISKTDEPLYDVNLEEKEGNTIIDERTHFSISLSIILPSFSVANITYPDGQTFHVYVQTGQTWTYKYEGIYYRVTLLSADDVTQIYKINIQEKRL